jgi:PAS domain S-box-containing protein
MCPAVHGGRLTEAEDARRMSATAQDPAPEQDEFPGVPQLRGEVAFRLLVDAVQDYAIFLLDPQGHVLTWNRGAERIKGYSADEIIGQHFSVFYVPEEREAGRPMRLLGLAAEHGRYEDEGWRVRRDGTRFWADVILTALRDDDGTPYAYAKITRDLTERRAAEEQQRALLIEQRARTAAEEALLARDRFLSIAAHELKTPVASLQLSAESLVRARDADRMDDERLSTGLQRMTKAAERLGDLVRELLDVSRLSAERAPLVLKPTDLAAVIRDVLARFEEQGEMHRIRFAGPVALWIPGDVARLDQVVTNLVDNAMKYSPDETPIEVELGTRDGTAVLEVRDRGIGLDEATVGRIFEPFGRAENAEHIQGMGLGLYISQQIVSRHGGTISADPRPDGAGAVFRVTLPGAEESAE